MEDDEGDEPEADAVMAMAARLEMMVGFGVRASSGICGDGNGGGTRKHSTAVAPSSNCSSSSSSQAPGRGRFHHGRSGRSAAELAGAAMLGIRRDRAVGPVDVSYYHQERGPTPSCRPSLDSCVVWESERIDRSVDYSQSSWI